MDSGIERFEDFNLGTHPVSLGGPEMTFFARVFPEELVELLEPTPIVLAMMYDAEQTHLGFKIIVTNDADKDWETKALFQCSDWCNRPEISLGFETPLYSRISVSPTYGYRLDHDSPIAVYLRQQTYEAYQQQITN